MNEEEQKIEVEEPYKEYEVREIARTDGEHYYVEDPQQDPNSNLTSVICTHCPSGVMIDSTKFEIKDGKIIERNGK